MKIFHKGKLVSSYGKGKKMEGRTKKYNGILIAKYKFDKSICDNLVPEFNAEFTNYKIVDEYLDTEDIVTASTETMMIMNYDAEPDEYGVLTTENEVENVSTFSAENIVTRSIYSEDLPTKMVFGYYKNDRIESINSLSDVSSLLSVDYINTNNLKSCWCMFGHCHSLASINISNWDTGKVTDMYSMFAYCNNLTSLDVSNFNTSNVTTMESMFHQCNNLTSLDVSNFNTSNVKNMRFMFYNCNNLTSLDVTNFNTSNATNMEAMFYGCQSLTSLDLSNWNINNINNMSYMFTYCKTLNQLNLPTNANTSKLVNISEMFLYCHSLTSLNLSNFDTSNVTNMYNMFNGCTNLTSLDVSNWDTRNVTDMHSMFYNCNNLTSISMTNSDYNSVNKIISVLPTRTTDNIGTLNIAGVDDYTQVDTTTIQSKYWNVLDHISIHYDSSYFTQGGMNSNGELYDNTNPLYNLCVMTDFIDIEHFKEVCVTTNRAEQGITVCTIYEYNSDKEYIRYVSHETNPQVTTTYNKSTDVKYIILVAFNVAYAQITPSDVDFDIVFR